MNFMDRRSFVVSTGAFTATLVSQAAVTTAQPSKDHQEPTGSPPDSIALLNSQFRELYAKNREELLANTPLAALMLIGTGEVWRVEFGKPVRSYPPTPWIAKVKGLMHAVIATQATSARLVRAKNLEAARADAAHLAKAVATAHDLIEGALPAEVAPSAKVVLSTLQKMAESWQAGQTVKPQDFPDALNKVRKDLDRVIAAAGEAVYQSVANGLRSFASESDPKLWQSCLVGVCGVGFARRDNIEIAAAISVMGHDVVGTRLLYLENAFTIPAGVAQIGASLADLALGQDVFGDPYRMWRDLLGDVAVAHVGKSFFPGMGKE